MEIRFVVIKKTDIPKYLTLKEQSQLNRLLNIINCGRANDGKSENQYLVVNTDEDYAHQVADIISASVKKGGN